MIKSFIERGDDIGPITGTVQEEHEGGSYMVKRAIKKEIEAKQNELKMNLSNNYKDLAHTALKELIELLEKYHASGDLKEKDYHKYRADADMYAIRMQNYHH